MEFVTLVVSSNMANKRIENINLRHIKVLHNFYVGPALSIVDVLAENGSRCQRQEEKFENHLGKYSTVHCNNCRATEMKADIRETQSQ